MPSRIPCSNIPSARTFLAATFRAHKTGPSSAGILSEVSPNVKNGAREKLLRLSQQMRLRYESNDDYTNSTGFIATTGERDSREHQRPINYVQVHATSQENSGGGIAFSSRIDRVYRYKLARRRSTLWANLTRVSG